MKNFTSYLISFVFIASLILGVVWVLLSPIAPAEKVIEIGSATTSDTYIAVGPKKGLGQTAQSFVFNGGEITAVQLYLKRMGEPKDLIVEIQKDYNNEPSRIALGVAMVSQIEVSEEFSWIEAKFITPVQIPAGKYWVYLKALNGDFGHSYAWGSKVGNIYEFGNAIDTWDAGEKWQNYYDYDQMAKIIWKTTR